jgi:predicted nucleic acid-binding protein
MHWKPDTLMEDALIAATAQVHRLTIATQYSADIKALGVEVFNLFEGS